MVRPALARALPPPDQMAPLLGQRLSTLCDEVSGVGAAWLPMEYALWDLRARRDGRPVYALLAALTGRVAPHPYRVPCYDTSLYMDDLHLSSDEAGAALIAAQAHDGYARGHRTFKVKVGRGARHLPVEEGTRRDIAVIRAVRAAIGPQATLLLDANNGYTLNLTKGRRKTTISHDVYTFLTWRCQTSPHEERKQWN